MRSNYEKILKSFCPDGIEKDKQFFYVFGGSELSRDFVCRELSYSGLFSFTSDEGYSIEEVAEDERVQMINLDDLLK